MPYPLEDERAKLLDMMEPRERLLFEQMESQMELTRTVLRAFRAAHIWAVVCGLALSVSVTASAVSILVHYIYR